MSSRIQFKPNYEKLVEALLYIVHKKAGIDHYKICKFIYLADKVHLNRYGRPVVGDRHVAMQWGPVASQTLDLIKGDRKVLAAAGIDVLPFTATEMGQGIICLSEPARSVNYEVFSKTDLAVLDEVIDQYSGLSFTELHNITSDDFCYRNAWKKRGLVKQISISYEDMIDETSRKSGIIDDLEQVSSRM